MQLLEGKKYIISHIYREVNVVANAIANVGYDFDDFTWWHELPERTVHSFSMNLRSKIEYRLL